MKPQCWLIAVVAAVHVGLLAGAVSSNTATLDEGRFLPAGFAPWEAANFSLAGDAPPLVRMAAVLPSLFSRHYIYYYDLNTSGAVSGAGVRRLEEEYAATFAAANRGFARMVRAARWMNLAWWLLGAWVIARWARALYGDAAGVLALLFWGIGPNVLSQEQVATPAFPAAVVLVGASDALRRHLDRPGWLQALEAGVWVGVALLVDYTSLLLLAACPLLIAARVVARGRSGMSRAGIARSLGQSALVVALGVYIVNFGYMFHGSGTALGDYTFASRALSGGPGASGRPAGDAPAANRFGRTWPGRVAVPLPADYVKGLDRRWAEFEEARSDARGRDSTAWDRLAAMAVRVPLAFWAMVLWCALMTVTRRPRDVPPAGEAAPWLVAAVVLASVGAGVVDPDRGLILAAPFGAVIASKLAVFLRPGPRWARGMALALALWYAAASLAAYPHPRAYLNEAVLAMDDAAARIRYGPREGGPDLERLGTWLKAHPAVRLRGLAVRGPVGPAALSFPPPPISPVAVPENRALYTRRVGPYPGDYVLDPTFLDRAEYRYFRDFRPMARVGAALFVYRVTPEAAERVRRELGLPPLAQETPAPDQEGKGKLLHRTFVDSRKRKSNYALYVPREYRGDVPYPLILFLHGYGDAGGLASRQYTTVGLPPSLKSQGPGFGFIVLCPQGQSGQWLKGNRDTARALELLALIQKEFRVDPSRIYLSGLSSGALGVWDLASRFPRRWAAIVPVSTSACNPAQAPRIKHIPCWCFHNSHDKGSPATIPRRMIRALRAAGGTPRYTEFLGFDHNAWDRAYATTELYDWLLQQRLPPSQGSH